jgi:fumarate reductase flavoprotein subunit
VILATGGFGGNKEMMAEYFGEKAGTGLVGTATGDGLKMAWSAGAAELGSNVAQWFGMKYDSSKTKNMPNGTSALTELVRNPLLFVDKNGKRFGNEEEAYESAALGTMMYNLPDAKMYIVLDQGIVDEVAEKGLADVFVDRWAHFYGQGVKYVENGKTVDLDASTEKLRTPTDYSSTLEEAVAAGVAYKADSIEELAQVLGMENLEETIATYNQLCADGNDTQYHKDAKFLNAVDEGPYYVVETALRCLGTLGGVKIDENMLLPFYAEGKRLSLSVRGSRKTGSRGWH